MNNTVFLMSFLLALSSSAFNQTPYFNKTYNLGEPADNEIAISFIETNNGYLVTGLSYSEAYPEESDKIQLYEVDKNGTLLWGKEYASDSIFISASMSRIFQCNDSTYEWFINQYDTINYLHRPTLVRFDRQGNLIYSKVLYDPAFTDPLYYIANQAIRTNDGGYLLVCNSGGWIVTLFKFDNLLELEWKKDIGAPNTYTGICNIFQQADSSYIIGSSYGYGNNDGDGRVIHLLKNGNINWTALTGSSLKDGACFVTGTHDSAYLAVSVYTTKASWWGDPELGRFVVNKINRNGQVLWSKIIGKEMVVPNIRALVELPDSTLVFSGANGYMTDSYMFRINFAGDSLLYKDLRYTDPTIHSYSIVDAQSTSDNGILFCGEIMVPDPVNDYPERPWLIKTDWYGCESVGCDSTDLYVFSNTPSRSICKGGITWFAVEGFGSGKQFQWQEKAGTEWVNLQDGQTYNGTETDTLNIVNSDLLNGNKTYRCMVYSEYWRLFTPDIFLYYYEVPIITQQPISVSVSPGDNVVFGIIASGIEAPAYQWYFMGNEILGATSNELIINQVLPSDTGYYYCKAWNNCGEVFSDTAWLNIEGNGISEYTYNQGIKVFPNPTSDLVTISFFKVDASPVEYFIYDTKSELVMQNKNTIVNGTSLLQTGTLTKGMYLLKVVVNTEQYFLKVVKQ